MDSELNHIFVYDTSRGVLTQVTHDGANDVPVWSPDGTRVAFERAAVGPSNLFWVQPDGNSAPERLTTSERWQSPASWTSDGKALAFLQYSHASSEIWVLPFGDGENEPRPFAQAPFRARYPTFSPDGRFLAYASDESGREESYVQSYPGPGERTQISAEGGFSPAWAHDGRELFYRASPETDGGKLKMMAVTITTVPVFVAGKARLLFDENHYEWSEPHRSYDVAADGRFLMLEPVGQPSEPVTELRVVLNWTEELQRLVPSSR